MGQGSIPKSIFNSVNRSKAEKEVILHCQNILNNKVESKTIRVKDKYYFPDIIIDDKLVVEYYGDYWHCNPLKYNEDFFLEKSKTYARDIWDRDKKREDALEKAGYKILVIWEKDYKEDREKTLDKLIKDIKKELKNESN